MKKIIALLLLFIFISSIFSESAFAGPKSSHYEFKDYSFGGSGGQTNSANYQMLGVIGDPVDGPASSSSYMLNEGLNFTINSNVPPAPSLSNNSNTYYNKLNCTLNMGNNPTDAEFAIAISTDNFVSDTKYIQADNTIGLNPAWQTNSLWGSSGFIIVGLTPGTTYSVKVAARQGNFTQSAWGPAAQQETANPTLSFSLSPNSVDIGQLTPATVITAPSTVTVNVDTNGTSGAIVYVNDNNSGLLSSSVSYTISAVSADLGGVSEGYGLRGSSITQATGGPMEILSPYDGAGSTTVGTLTTTKQPIFDSSTQPVTGGQGIFEIEAKASNTAKAASDYADTITVVASATF